MLAGLRQMASTACADRGRRRRAVPPLLILHTVGAKSGRKRQNPLYMSQGDGVVVLFASRAGEPENPDWYHNLSANPDVELEFGDRTVGATARRWGGEERDRL